MQGEVYSNTGRRPEEIRHGDEDEERRQNLRVELAARLRKQQSNLNTVTPTRTLRLTQQEQSSSRDPTPIEIANRSPRSRTPRQRFETPPEHHEHSLRDNEDRIRQHVPVRLVAGIGVGVSAQDRRIVEETVGQQELSAKQGPSHRKVRRWNNDRLVDLDLTNSKVKSIYAKARSEAHLYRDVFNPIEDCHRSDALTRFINDENLKGTRESFFEGSGPMTKTKQQNQIKRPDKHSLARIEPRLRRVVIRACHNSCAATKVIQRFEDCLMYHYFPEHAKKELPVEWWAGVLVDEPTMTNVPDDFVKSSQSLRRTLEFTFQNKQNAGFHRLLLHALCQFHGLKATARNSDKEIRMSSVSGRIETGDARLPISLIYCIEEVDK